MFDFVACPLGKKLAEPHIFFNIPLRHGILAAPPDMAYERQWGDKCSSSNITRDKPLDLKRGAYEEQ